MMTRSRRHNSETQAQDRLSSLPDDLLTNHILSLLTTTDSVSTSVLSTRWKHLFKSVPVLHFNFNERWNKHDTQKFVEFVNNVLRVHNVPSTRSFRLLLDSCTADNVRPSVRSWISAASRCNPQLVEMDIGLTRKCTPIPLLTISRLIYLKLEGHFEFNNIDMVCLPSLKTLNIGGGIFRDGDSAKKLFSGCPVLEDLTLFGIFISGTKVFSINCPLLKRLTIDGSDNCNACEWELNVPNLEYMYCEKIKSKLYSVTILKSLHKAHICLRGVDISEDDDDDGIWELVNKFEQIQFLSLSGLSMESLASDSFSLPMLNNLKTLELCSRLWQGWKLFPTLLERAPCLELLVVKDGLSDFRKQLPGIHILLPKHIPLCYSQSLKKVEFCMFEENEVVYECLGYLLKNAKVLEKLSITVTSKKRTRTVTVESLSDEEYEKEYSASLERQFEIKKKLSALPKASATCQIVVRRRVICSTHFI